MFNDRLQQHRDTQGLFMHSLRRIACLGLALAASHAAAATVQLNFTGTYDTQGNVVLGQQGAMMAYSYSISYDTALNTSAFRFNAGDAMGGATAAGNFYGYSRSGVVSATVRFGTQTWDAADLVERTPNSASAPTSGLTPTLLWRRPRMRGCCSRLPPATSNWAEGQVRLQVWR